jgi:hypothetical protein
MDCSIKANAFNYIIRSPRLDTKIVDMPKDGWLTHSESQVISDR